MTRQSTGLDYYSPAPSASAYAALLAPTAAALRSADSKAYVISAGLSPPRRAAATSRRWTSSSSCASWGRTRSSTPSASTRTLTPCRPATARPGTPGSRWRDPGAKSILTANGTRPADLGDGVRCTHRRPGNDRDPDEQLRAGAYPDHVDEATQATIASDVLRTAAESTTVAAVFWYTNQDLGTSPTTIEHHFGLRRVDGSKKPTYGAFQDAVLATRQQTGGARRARARGICPHLRRTSVPRARTITRGCARRGGMQRGEPERVLPEPGHAGDQAPRRRRASARG